MKPEFTIEDIETLKCLTKQAGIAMFKVDNAGLRIKYNQLWVKLVDLCEEMKKNEKAN